MKMEKNPPKDEKLSKRGEIYIDLMKFHLFLPNFMFMTRS